MSDTFLFAQLQPFTLSGAGSSIGDTTITLASFQTIDGVDLAMTDFGSIGYGTLEPNNGTYEEQISFTGITQNANGTATLTGVKTVLFIAPYTETSGLAKSHIGGAKFVISNTSGFYNKITSKDNDETITGLWTFVQAPQMSAASTPTIETQLVPKSYVDNTAFAGAPNMSLTQKGIGEEATAAEINAGTQTGGTSAELIVNPKYLKDSIYYTQLPSSIEKVGLIGTSSPSLSNPYTNKNDVLQLTANSQTVSGASITFSGTPSVSHTYLPRSSATPVTTTELTPKAYVDQQVSTSVTSAKVGLNTHATNSSATDVIAHGLGRVPKLLSMTMCMGGNTEYSISNGYYDGSTGKFAGLRALYNGSAGGDFGGIGIGRVYLSASAYISASATVDATNITITYDITGSPTGTAQMLWTVI